MPFIMKNLEKWREDLHSEPRPNIRYCTDGTEPTLCKHFDNRTEIGATESRLELTAQT